MMILLPLSLFPKALIFSFTLFDLIFPSPLFDLIFLYIDLIKELYISLLLGLHGLLLEVGKEEGVVLGKKTYKH